MFSRNVAPGIEIRLFEIRDAEAIFQAIERNRDYLRVWLPWVDLTASPDDVRRFILKVREQFESGHGPQCALWADGAIAGSIGCHPIDWLNRNCSLGYWIDQAYQGKGIMSRCCETMLDYLFDGLELHRVAIHCGEENFRSCSIPQRLGFTREGLARDGAWVNDRWLNMLSWSMLEDDWRARRRRQSQAPAAHAPSKVANPLADARGSAEPRP